MNMFRYELKANGKFTVTWSLALTGLVILFLSLFPAISREGEDFKRLLEGFPEGVRLALGLSVENITSLLGYYSYSFLYISLCGAMQGMILGMSILSKEVREKTADFLLTKPVTRWQIVTAKVAAAFVSLVITYLIYLGAAMSMAALVEREEYDSRLFFLLSLTLFFLQLLFFALGMILSLAFPRLKTVLPISLGTVMAFFVIGAIASTTGDDVLRYLTPFKYFDFTYIMENSRYEASFLVIGSIIIVTAITASYYVYARRDIQAV